MNKIEMVKGAGELVVSLGVTKIVTNIVCATMPAGTGAVAKVCITAGSFVLGNMVSNAAVNHVEQKFNATVTEIKNIIEKRDSNEKKEEVK